jgi:TonB family protein
MMRRLFIITATGSFLAAVVAVLFSGSRERGGTDKPATASESTARYLAVVKPMPVYPREALSRAVQGVVVASIVVGVAGRLERVTILESPDVSTARAVREALAGWQLRRWKGATATTKLQAKLTFYFRIEHGRGRVLNPEDLGGEREKRPSVRPGTWVTNPQSKSPVSDDHGPGL